MNDGTAFRPWPLQWTAEHIRRFWNWYGTNAALQSNYFSKGVGGVILGEVLKVITPRGPVVDLGAGPGHLTERLVHRGLDTMAIDTSPDSVAALNQRLQGQPHFLGARVSTADRVPLEDGYADLILLIETVEHLDDAAARTTLGEARRLLRQGGHIVVTTPNEENLDEHCTLCPNCGCVFHTIQHLRSFTTGTMAQLMESAGFKTISSQATLFSPYPPLIRPLHRWKYRHFHPHMPHLLYIGRRSE